MVIKILIVEDNRDTMFTIKKVLSSIDKDYEFIEAFTAEEGFEKLKSVKPDLIIMDIMLPGMDGAKAAVKIKEDPQLSKIPLLFLTAKTDSMTKGMGAVVGEDLITKPFDANDLDKRIKKALSKSKH